MYNKKEKNREERAKFKNKLFTFIVENTWLKKDLPKSMLNSLAFDVGWGNGYVIVPKEHPIYKIHYDNINVDINGGLTFSRLVEDLIKSNWKGFDNITIPEELKNGWIVGFDTAHYGDTLERWSKEAVEAETERLKEQLINYKSE
jgi:hypothetical protein